MTEILFIRSNSFSPRVIKEAKSMVNNGYDVSLFLWNRNGEDLSKNHGREYAIYEFKRSVPFGSFRFFYHWFIWWYAIIKHIMGHDYDIIHVCGVDSYPPVIIGKLAKKYSIIYDIFDFFGPSLPGNTPHIVRNFFTVVEKFLIQFADAVIIVDESRLSQLKGSKASKLTIIVNCVSDEFEKLKKYEKIRDRFVIFYGGMLSKSRGLIQLIEAIKDESDLELIVAGTGEDEIELISLFDKYNNIKYLGQVSHLEAIKLTYMSNVIFGFYDPVVPNNQLASPNKLFEAMMCATPIIVNEETTMADIVNNENCGVIVPYSDVKQLKNILIKLKNDQHYCENLGQNGRIAFEEKYNWDIMEQRLVNLYCSLTCAK